MEVNPGYKQTEAGVIPEDWQVLNLEATARVVDSLHRTPHFSQDGYPMVRVKDVKTGDLNLTETLKVSKAVYEEFIRNYKPKRGDIVLSRVGSYGVSSFVETDEPFCIGQNTVVLQPRFPARFLYYALNSRAIRQQIEDGSYGSGYKSLSLKNIKELRIPLPSTELEQCAIAAALRDVDRLLDTLNRLIVKKRDLKEAAMQQLLTGQTRLPGFSREWEVKTLGDVLEQIGDGATPSTADRRNYGGGIHWVVIEDIKDEITTTETTLTERGLRACATKLWEPGTLIVSTGATIGDVGIARIPVTTKQGICGLVVDRNEATPEFLKYWFMHNKASLLSKAQGSTIKEVRAPTLVKFELLIPSVPEQTAITTVLSEMDAEIAALEKRRDKTRALKQAMMQELLTGRTRLVQPEKQEEFATQ